jgi:hypothetical protein
MLYIRESIHNIYPLFICKLFLIGWIRAVNINLLSSHQNLTFYIKKVLHIIQLFFSLWTEWRTIILVITLPFDVFLPPFIIMIFKIRKGPWNIAYLESSDGNRRHSQEGSSSLEVHFSS